VAHYPLDVSWGGILVDDPGQNEDIVGRVRDVIEVIFKDRSEAIESEACKIVGLKELREYFRKPGKGGFWDDHMDRYSSSRRKAPIYWLLQSSKKNYGIWLYYHRLDKDLLFKALMNYVEPKIRLESSRLDTLRGQRAAVGESGGDAKRLAKEFELQEDYISEPKDFEDKLRRAANLHLVPDLDDGIVLNIAPSSRTRPMEGSGELLGGTPRRKVRVVEHRQAASAERAGAVMPVVTEHLFQLIAKQVEDRGLVVWYDPEQAYGEAARELTLPNTTIARYEGSFFKLRREIDHLLNNEQPPRLVVYVPLERTETNSALIELDCAGTIMQPRQQPPACNTRLSVIARNALKPILGEDQVIEIERQVVAGKLTLTDLNSLAEKGKDISTGVLALIFGSANPQEVALAFLNSDKYDEEIDKKEAEKELCRLLEVSFDIELPASASLSNWRARLEEHVLLTDLVSIFKKNVPASLDSFSVARKSGAIDACVLETGGTTGTLGIAM